MEEYKKSCHDALDWEDVDQLHAATLEISKSCFEFKKICVGLIGVAATILVKFTKDRLDHSFFFVPLLLAVGFWIADATSYYYQRQIRSLMDKTLIAIAGRNSLTEYTRKKTKASWTGAFFNASMALYYVLVALLLLGWISYGMGGIGR